MASRMWRMRNFHLRGLEDIDGLAENIFPDFVEDGAPHHEVHFGGVERRFEELLNLQKVKDI